MIYDFLVIGGGVIGTAVLYELSHYDVSCALLEKENDVGTACSSRNSGIVHAGYDCKPGTFKARFNVRGSRIFPELCAELGVLYKKTGSMVIGGADSLADIQALHERGKINGVYTEILSRNQIAEREPNVSRDAEYALYAPDAGVVTPYKLVIAYADNAVINGADIFLNAEADRISRDSGVYTVTAADGRVFFAKSLINAAGYAACKINQAANAEEIRQDYALGEYFLLDKRESKNINTVLFPLPDSRGKGILVAPTAEGNVLYGPTSTPVTVPDDYAVTAEGLKNIRDSVGRIYEKANFASVIKTFAGVRTVAGLDFIIEKSKKAENYITIAGICSPGLTAAPAIAEYVGELASEITALGSRKKYVNYKEEEASGIAAVRRQDSVEKINERIRQNPRYGHIVCRCETVSEGEIIKAIHSPLTATTVDAVKRRVRAGMGRCQGGFCTPKVIEILARELNIEESEILKNRKGSKIVIDLS
ncbi:MAG: NAD(P)/FAD-dependent oxidoreductase [Clostridiales bacterium]|jgi:glycerol-3-phosphate dehydrogenase|nr:NAD(P)/FAD-dependent oxidoreductase [Clostridiales bacterium]